MQRNRSLKQCVSMCALQNFMVSREDKKINSPVRKFGLSVC